MPEIINRNATIQENAKAAFDLTSEQLTKIISDRIVPIVDLTPQIAAPSTKITDGTDTCDVTSAGELEVANAGLAKGASGQALVNYANAYGGTALVGGAAATLMRTNTATKTLYVTQLSIGDGTGPNELCLYDGATLMFHIIIAANNTTNQVTFLAPLIFTADVRMRASANGQGYLNFTGWEE